MIYNSREGNLDDIKSCGSLHQFLEKYHKQHGPIIAFWLGPKKCISIASSKLFQEHATYFDRPGKDILQFHSDNYECVFVYGCM